MRDRAYIRRKEGEEIISAAKVQQKKRYMQINRQKNDDFEGNGIPEVIVRAERDKNSGITVSRRDHADRDAGLTPRALDKESHADNGGNYTAKSDNRHKMPEK